MPRDPSVPFVTRTFPARYPFTCPECDFGYEAGDQARLVDGEIHCRSCADDLEPSRFQGVDPDW